MRSLVAIAVLTALSLPVSAQSFYKCPGKSSTDTSVIQQMPCSPTGGGETIVVKSLKSTGTSLELTEQGKTFLKDIEENRQQQKEANLKESHRLQALAVEQEKADAADRQAKATASLARAAWAPKIIRFRR